MLLLAVARPGADLYVVLGISSERVFGLASETNTRLNIAMLVCSLTFHFYSMSRPLQVGSEQGTVVKPKPHL